MIAELMEHTNRGTQLQLADGWVKITERYFRVRWAGAHWRAQKFWTWEPQSELIEDVPELVGEYCRRAKLVVPKEVELALRGRGGCVRRGRGGRGSGRGGCTHWPSGLPDDHPAVRLEGAAGHPRGADRRRGGQRRGEAHALGEVYLSGPSSTEESTNLRHEPERSVSGVDEVERVSSVATVDWVLDDVLGSHQGL